MRLLAVMLLLAGCATVPAPEQPASPPAEPVQQTALLDVWQTEVAEDVAILRAIRPSLTGPASALNLYDSATQGLASLSGEPTAKAVDTFKGYVEKPDENRLKQLREEKLALDKKTDALEAKVEAEKQERLKAEAAKKASDEAAERAAVQARKAESVSMMTKVGAAAVAVGVLALLFGHWLKISKMTAGMVIGAGLGVSIAAPWLIDLAEMRWILAGLFGLLALDLVVIVGIKTWRKLRPPRETPPQNQGGD